jgi:small subunit ribosomal protein S19e
MTTVFDVPPEALIPKVADKLKQVAEIQPPEWAPFVKTGPHREKPPEKPDWWHTRMAAILRKVYVNGPVGTSRLSASFGGARDRRDSPNKAVKGSGSISRKGLQQLEKAGLISNIKGKGRIVTPKGRKFLDNAAHEVALDLAKAAPGAARH